MKRDMSNLKNCHKSVETVDVKGIYFVKIGDDEVEQAAPPCNIPVPLRQMCYPFSRQLVERALRSGKHGFKNFGLC